MDVNMLIFAMSFVISFILAYTITYELEKKWRIQISKNEALESFEKFNRSKS